MALSCGGKVEDLNDFLLFVGNNTPMCVHISNATNCQRNTIYFSDDHVQSWDLTRTHGGRGHDTAVFDMSS